MKRTEHAESIDKIYVCDATSCAGESTPGGCNTTRNKYNVFAHNADVCVSKALVEACTHLNVAHVCSMMHYS